jgi:tetratricopeptide (TPR) repeat protein
MRLVAIIILVLAGFLGFSQGKSELLFVEHLLNKGNYKECIFVLKDTAKFSKTQLDSVNYFKGWADYSLKNLEEATQSFLKVRPGSSFYSKSKFFAGYNQTFLGKYSEARRIYQQLSFDDMPRTSLIIFETGGINMLDGEWQTAKKQLEKVDLEIAFLNQQVAVLKQIIKDHENHRAKSAILAGIMSGIIPGSGRIYTGRTGEGLASMIATTGFGLITWENYHKLGAGNLKTLFFGGIFLASYVSNIYGSVISVRITEQNYADVQRNQILFQLHIPLRNFFD